ncbi:MAG: hypothetical protein BRC33_13810 [Cyanobacteria bacterium SW_9_44_58]|nr:MAG: hypothetical protein BRC33_13810 [Cyanobacteria bacterium SW_9_44_58]
MSLSRLVLGGVISLTLSSLVSPAIANPSSATNAKNNHNNASAPFTYHSIPQLFENALSYESGDFFENRSLESQIEWLFGVTPSGDQYRFPDFPENELTRDGHLLDTLYRDYLQYQTGGEPIRTRDLENPYTTSLGSSDYSEPK